MLSRVLHVALGCVVLAVLAGAIGGFVILSWMAGSDYTEFGR